MRRIRESKRTTNRQRKIMARIGGEAHADIAAAYHFACDNPAKLTRLTVALFEAFSGMEEIKVQYVTEHAQGVAELTATDPVVAL